MKLAAAAALISVLLLTPSAMAGEQEQLERDLVRLSFDISRLEQAYSRDHPTLAGEFEYGLMPLPRGMRLLIEFVERLPFPEAP